MRLLKILGVIVVALAALYFLGPHPAKPVYTNLLPTISDSGAALDGYVANLESRHPLKKNNEARIVWANDSLKILPNTRLCICMGLVPVRKKATRFTGILPKHLAVTYTWRD